MATRIQLTCNGDVVEMLVEDHWTLLDLLREQMGLLGTKEGCGSGECGACTVIVDGMAVNACIYPVVEADGKNVTTVEGLAGDNGVLHPLQQSFIENGGIQCGFCTPGMLMSAKALLDENPAADPDQIRRALAGNICRCTGYVQIVESVKAVGGPVETPGEPVAWKEAPPPSNKD